MATALVLPTPPASPSPTMVSPNNTLPGRINVATRKQHTNLNRLLISRLPLALPPHTETPELFGRGIVPFARIFALFEVEWELFTRHVSIKPETGSTHDIEVRKWLARLRPHGLARSDRLKNDLQHLRAIIPYKIYHTPDLGDKWTRDMRTLMRSKPHVFVAFAWVFYMAVFSGGRWIRQQLANGGAGFWQQSDITQLDKEQDSALLDVPGFSFLSFEGDQDGEDIKALFKSRLTEGETLLTPEEKQDVIDTAQQLFDRSILLVTEMDRMLLKQKISSWIPWMLVAASSLLVFLYGLGQIERFAGFVS